MTVKFKNRIDYVDLGAFGVEKEGQRKCENKTSQQEYKFDEFNHYICKYSKEGDLYHQMQSLNNKLDELNMHLLIMANRYDQNVQESFSFYPK